MKKVVRGLSRWSRFRDWLGICPLCRSDLHRLCNTYADYKCRCHERQHKALL